MFLNILNHSRLIHTNKLYYRIRKTGPAFFSVFHNLSSQKVTFRLIYHMYYNHYKYINFCGLIFPLIVMYSCMRYLVNTGFAKCLKKSSHNSKFQRGLRKEFIHPTQMRAYIFQNYDISMNQNPSFVC